MVGAPRLDGNPEPADKWARASVERSVGLGPRLN